MVRAATSGGFDYRDADPYDRTWRVKHALSMRDMQNINAAQVLQATHAHWLAYVSHSRLEADSWKDVKTHAHTALQSLQTAIIPWYKPEENTSKKDTIEAKYGKLIKKYKDMVARKKAEREALDAAQQDAQNPNEQ